jgi:S-DNA-T family DNA segregation ATPase FtsK/SpoIIIE
VGQPDPRHRTGTGYVFGEGLREPLRIRAGWVPDHTIKQLETFITSPLTFEGAALALSAPSPGSSPGGTT